MPDNSLSDSSIGSFPRGCSTTLLAVGVLVVLCGYFWHIPQLTYTAGLIVDAKPSNYGSTRRLITYEYTALGVRHRSQRFLSYWYINAGKFDVGSPFPVYFVTDHPELSYAPNRPIAAPIVVMGIMMITAGIAVIFFARPHRF